MKIKSFLKLVAVLFPLSIHLIACGSNPSPVSSANVTPTFVPGSSPTSVPTPSPTSVPTPSPTSVPEPSPTPTIAPYDPGITAVPRPISPSDCTLVSDHWDCTITLNYIDNNDQRSLPWSVSASNLPGVTFDPSSNTLTPSNHPDGEKIIAHIPTSDCYPVTDGFVFAFPTVNGQTTTSWDCLPTPTPTNTPTSTPTDTPTPTPTDTPTPIPTDTPTPIPTDTPTPGQ